MLFVIFGCLFNVEEFETDDRREKSMPLPWKKTRVARISRLVADLHSPKRGGSLVVQTGFPTSLVDLFVKNRDRLKKQSKKNKSQSHSQIEISNPILEKPLPSIYTVDSSRNEIATAIHDRELVVVEEFDGGGCGGGGDGDGSKWNSFLAAGFKMFVVLVLALSTKTLAVGVTMSAILLLLLEYVGVSGLFCSKATTRMISFLRRIKFNRSNLDVKCLNKSEIREESVENSSCEMVYDIGGNSSLEEEIQVEEETRTGQCLDMEEQVKIKDVLMNSYNDRRNQGGKFKFKEKLVKKLVPKKLRDSKKKKKWEKIQVESSRVFGENKLSRLLEQEQDDENESSSIVSLKEEERDIAGESEGAGLVCHDQVTKSQVHSDIQKNSGYLILILIVLAGLVGGRIVALVLILAWLLMLKLIGISRSTSFSVSY